VGRLIRGSARLTSPASSAPKRAHRWRVSSPALAARPCWQRATPRVFQVDNVPPGRGDLFVDGRAVNPTNDPAKPQWPSLHFEAYVVRGQKNELPHAIYLPALLTSEAKIVGGNEDVTLTIPGLEGFAMKVKANSVTFPDGSRVGTLVVSPVTADKLPMAPPAGFAQFGAPAWTIQPAGTRFDPPIEVTMPNSFGEQPGYNLAVVQWDHDLAQFVPMGRATVSGDGALIRTDPGSGITKAGWGGGGGPSGPNEPQCKAVGTSCPACSVLGSTPGGCPSCRPDPSQDGKTRIGSLGGQLQLDSEPIARLRKFMTPLGAFIETKGSVMFAYSGDELCCSTDKSGVAMKLEGSGGGGVEGMAAFPLLPALKRLSTFVFGDWLSGPSLTVKLTLAGSVFGAYDGCKGQRQAPAGRLALGVEVALSTLGAQTEISFADGSSKRAELRLLDIGAAGQGQVTPKRWVSNGLLFGFQATADMFVKSQISIGSFGWTALDFKLPIFTSDDQEFVLTIPGMK